MVARYARACHTDVYIVYIHTYIRESLVRSSYSALYGISACVSDVTLGRYAISCIKNEMNYDVHDVRTVGARI